MKDMKYKDLLKKLLYLLTLLLITTCSTHLQDNTINPESQDPPGSSDIINGDFSTGKSYWYLWQDDNAESSFVIEENTSKISITNPGKQKWSITLANTTGVILEKGHSYTLFFSARSNTSERIYASMGMSKEPYYGYSGGYPFVLSPEMHPYSFTFNMRQETDLHSNFQFQLGGNGEREIWFDDISIRDNGPSPEIEVSADFPSPRSTELKRGIQFGLELASPYEGTHVPELTETYFEALDKDGRFDHIRLPVWWEYHVEKAPPYTIDPYFMQKVDWAVSQSLSRGYPTILNMHWFRALEENPPKHKEELLATWKHIAEYYKNYPDHLYFDIMNEPNGNLDNSWNDYAIELYDIIREISPDRPLIISGIYWAHMSHLTQLELPERILQDPNVLIQFHPYVPGDFCFQGSAGNGRDQLEGIRWRGTEEERAYISGLMDTIDSWAADKGLRLYNGEFTAMASGGSLLEDRLCWMRFITDECEKRGIPWNYYDFSGDECYVYDIATGQWNEEVMGALFD